MLDATSTGADYIGQLFARINYERQARLSPGDFKLSNMIRLMERLGNPQLNYPVIHVAGTKGKGSVCSMIGSILSAMPPKLVEDSSIGRSPMRVGVYSSPHLDRINQRIVIGGVEISDDALTDVLRRFEPVIREFDDLARESGTKQLTFFEVITAVAFQSFSEAKLDVVILEVGMGGRLDSTNVCQPDVCVITSISLDHTRQLGSTLEKIAAEKAGIIKPGIPVVNGAIEPESKPVIDAVAIKNDCPILHLHRDFGFMPDTPRPGQFAYQSNFANTDFQLSGLRVGMRGRHQYQNAAIAIAACQQFMQFASGTRIREKGPGKPESGLVFQANGSGNKAGTLYSPTRQPNFESGIRQGLTAATLPGRCEIVGAEPLVILDIAHNVASTAALAATLKIEIPEFGAARERILLFAVSRDKDVTGMIAELAPQFDRIVVTQYHDNPRCRSAADVFKSVSRICRKIPRNIEVSIADSPAAAWSQLITESDRSRAICVTGSAFLVAELGPLVRQWSKDRC